MAGKETTQKYGYQPSRERKPLSEGYQPSHKPATSVIKPPPPPKKNTNSK
jgi:hypothetical protein